MRIHQPWFNAHGRIHWLKLTSWAALLAWLLSQGVLWLEHALRTPPWLMGLIGVLIILQGLVVTVRECISLIAALKKVVLKLRIHQPLLQKGSGFFKQKVTVVSVVHVTALHQQLGIMRC